MDDAARGRDQPSTVGVHHGSIVNVYAIRDAQLVLVREESHGFDVNRDGSHDDDDLVTDYDKLTWVRKRSPGTTERAALVLATPNGLRTTTIAGKTTTTATWSGDHVTLHLHAEGPLVVRVCSETPCTTTKVGKGDHELPVDADEIAVVLGGRTYPLHVERLELAQRFPGAPKPW